MPCLRRNPVRRGRASLIHLAALGVLALAARPAGATGASFGPDGFTLASADGQNVLRLRGNLSVDYRYFIDSDTPAAADTWIVRKLRPTIEGTLDGRFDFRFMPDFGQGRTVLQDAWVDARVRSWLILTAGKFKAPIGLERLQLEQFARFIEPSLVSDLLPYRSLGFQVGGSIADGVLSYQLGIFDATLDGSSTESNAIPDANSTGKATGHLRIFARPFVRTGFTALRGLGFGVAETYVEDSGTAAAGATTSLLASYRTTGQQPLFSYRAAGGTGFNDATIARGIERRLVPQLYYYLGPLGLLAEYAKVDQQVHRALTPAIARAATLESTAWQVQLGLFLTGEDEAYDRAPVRSEVGRGGLGAWELVARYHELRFDDAAFVGGADSFANPATAVRAARAAGVGINWYLTRNFKVQLDYEMTRFEGGAPTGDRPDERVLTSRFALIF